MTVLKVEKLVGGYRGHIELSNGFVKLHIPKRSTLLNGKKLQKGKLYEITLKEVKNKKK